MNMRMIGEWMVTWGVAEDYIESWGEDGPYTRRVSYVLVMAQRGYGDVYTCATDISTEEEAGTYCNALPTDFDPRNDDNWNFLRNCYGSKAYQANWHEEEYDRMDAEERYHYGR